MKTAPAWVGGGLALLAALAVVPVRHRAWLERSEGNPVQCVRLESRSLLGLRRTPWGVRLEGAEAWGNARDGFFFAPATGAGITLTAWPGFHQDFQVAPAALAVSDTLPVQGDRDAFRAWFVAILEQQLDGPSPAWEPAQRDCAGLLRFAFREAWGPHTEAWRDRTGFPAFPAAPEPSLRLAGPWRNAFPTPRGWNPFARGVFLRTLACEKVGRDPAEAQPGDLVFFSRGGARTEPDHAMAFVRPDMDGQPMLLYHTGPEGSGATRREGEVRRIRLDELLHHPDADFRPQPENPSFLGVYRWKVLCGGSELASLPESTVPSRP